MKYNFITIEGNIGAGKTTLSRLLSKRMNTRLILEEFADNPFLPKFYQNKEQYAFPLELFFMAERYKQMKDYLKAKDIFHQSTISDYLFTKSLLFAKVNLPDEEFNLYRRLYNIIYPQLIKPDLLIYLHASVHKLRDNIKRRNRSYEQSIDPDYLVALERTYTQFIKQHQYKTLIVDVENADFLGNERHLDTIVEALEKDYGEGQNYLQLPD